MMVMIMKKIKTSRDVTSELTQVIKKVNIRSILSQYFIFEKHTSLETYFPSRGL